MQLKTDVFKIGSTVTNYLGHSCKKMCWQELLKIAQSGHTAHGLRPHLFFPLRLPGVVWGPRSCSRPLAQADVARPRCGRGGDRRAAKTRPSGKVFKSWAVRGLFLYIFVCLYSTHFIENKICWWLNSNRGPLVSEADALPTAPKPLPRLIQFALRIVRLMIQLVPYIKK